MNKYVNLSLLGIIFLMSSLIQAGSSFGGALAGSFIGSGFANAVFRPTYYESPSYVVERPVYVSRPSSGSSTISLKELNNLKRRVNELLEENDDLRANIKALERENKDLYIEKSMVEKQLGRCLKQ